MAGKLKIAGHLAIEVTQRCNLNCDHCLRGCARNVNITKEIIDKTLDNFEHISSITFTGGEPTLNPEAIIYTIDQIKARGISVGSFYLVTNCVNFSGEVVLKLLELYALCYEKEMCGLCVSVDEFHDNRDMDAYDMYSALGFFRTDKEHEDGWNGGIINRGNAKEYSIGTFDKKILQFNPEYAEMFDNAIQFDDVLYVNARGDVFFDCDLSYELQDENRSINVVNESIAEWMFMQMYDNECLDKEPASAMIEELGLIPA